MYAVKRKQVSSLDACYFMYRKNLIVKGIEKSEVRTNTGNPVYIVIIIVVEREGAIE